jgi:hypothetical protein
MIVLPYGKQGWRCSFGSPTFSTSNNLQLRSSLTCDSRKSMEPTNLRSADIRAEAILETHRFMHGL